VQKPRVTGYSASRGIKGLRQACSRYYDRRFGVKLDAEDQVIATMGSKEGFANLAQAITAPGDVIYAPDPSYPLHAYGFVIAGAVIQGIPAITAEEYLAGVKAALAKADKPPMAMVVCFPSNPTGMTADRDFYEEINFIVQNIFYGGLANGLCRRESSPDCCADTSKILFGLRVLYAYSSGGLRSDGEGYVRMALVENEQRIRQAARNMKALFQSSSVAAE